MAYRRGNSYYRSRREGRQVVTDYLGSGEAGRLAAEADELERAALRAERIGLHRQSQADTELYRPIDEAGDVIRVLSDALLLCHGYHTHKGQWRRLRTNVNL